MFGDGNVKNDRWWERGKYNACHLDDRGPNESVCRVNTGSILTPHHHLQATVMDGSMGGGPEIQLPEIDKRTVIGVSVAIAGNILISLALNLQKLSHRQRDLAAAHAEAQKSQHDRVDTTRLPNPPMERVRELSCEDREEDFDDIAGGELDTIRRPRFDAFETESEPLLPRVSSHGSTGRITTGKRASLLRFFFPAKSPYPARQPPATPRRQTPPRPPSMSRTSSNTTTSSSAVSNGKESDYLKSKLW